MFNDDYISLDNYKKKEPLVKIPEDPTDGGMNATRSLSGHNFQILPLNFEKHGGNRAENGVMMNNNNLINVRTRDNSGGRVSP